jgi:geranyl-CoA carboxylase alpha subunit
VDLTPFLLPTAAKLLAASFAALAPSACAPSRSIPTPADTAEAIGGSAARDSYLNISALLAACRRSGAQAVHPGYGFLSENADFAQACSDAGLIFVGPPAQAIHALGNKSAAKRLANRIGVPCLPGYAEQDQAIETLLAQAQKIGPPVMIKAAAGGGGRGMRRCDDTQDTAALRGLLESARTEAQSSFGNGDLLLERLVESARHVEVQVFGDSHGNYLHLGERDCSTQRRNQKILEEAPAPGMSESLRRQMGESAIRLAREVGYIGAGTIEYLLAPDGQFYFLEMNTRLQVEHPVTEAVTGLDLVELQLRIAQGQALPFKQDELSLNGHSIEARLCAEDAYGGFVPQSGDIAAWCAPSGDGIRFDHGLKASGSVPPYYDSMIAKLIVWAPDRDSARRKLIKALSETSVFGITTNRDYLIACLRARPFAQAQLSTRWLTDIAVDWQAPKPDARWLATAAACQRHQRSIPFGALANWTSLGDRVEPIVIEHNETSYPVALQARSANGYQVTVSTSATESASFAIEFAAAVGAPGSGLRQRVIIDGQPQVLSVHLDGETGFLDLDGINAAFINVTQAPPQRKDQTASGIIMSKMHGLISKLNVAAGQSVRKGELLLAIEAMKMEHRIEAPSDGTIAEIGVQAGQQVSPGRLLIRLEPAA